MPKSYCKSCGSELKWFKTLSGKSIPIDPKPEKRVVLRGGLAIISDTWRSHFETCPSASVHRRVKKED